MAKLFTQDRVSEVASQPYAARKRLRETDHGANLLNYHRIVVLTDGESQSGSAKTAISLLRYRPDDICAVLDSCGASNCLSLFGIGGGIPVINSLDEAPDADAVFIGIAPAGGRLPEAWRPLLKEALERNIDLVSGLHDFLSDDGELSETARRTGARIIDVRRNYENVVAGHVDFPAANLRIHTVGHDCSVGKMVAAMEVERELSRRGEDAKFLATGQTGIMIAGDGVPVDCVVADFVNGAVEQLVVRNQGHDIVLVEGQGSLTHPSFSGVTLGLLHGCAPQGLILCYEAARKTVKGLSHVPVHGLAKLIQIYEMAANVRHPCKVIGVAVNTRRLAANDADEEVKQVSGELDLPACDVYRHGAGALADAVLALRSENLVWT